MIFKSQHHKNKKDKNKYARQQSNAEHAFQRKHGRDQRTNKRSIREIEQQIEDVETRMTNQNIPDETNKET